MQNSSHRICWKLDTMFGMTHGSPEVLYLLSRYSLKQGWEDSAPTSTLPNFRGTCQTCPKDSLVCPFSRDTCYPKSIHYDGRIGFSYPYPRISKSDVLRDSYVIKNRENRKGKRNPHLSHKKQAYNWLVFFLLELQIGYRHYSQQKTWTNIYVHSAFGSFSLGLPFLGFMKQKQEQHGNWKRNFIALFLVPKHPIVQNLFWLLSWQFFAFIKKSHLDSIPIAFAKRMLAFQAPAVRIDVGSIVKKKMTLFLKWWVILSLG